MDASLSRILDPIPAMLRKYPSDRVKSYTKEQDTLSLPQNGSTLRPVEIDQSFNPRHKPVPPQKHANRGPFDIEERSFKAVESLREFVDGKWQKRKIKISKEDGFLF